MCKQRLAFGRRLKDLVQLGAIQFRLELLDTIVERRLKAIWVARSCPNCEAETLQAIDGSDRVWCGRCNWKTTYTRGTPFYNSELAHGEFLIAFILYAGTLLSINQITFLLSSSYKTPHDQIRELESYVAFRLSGNESPRQSMGRRRSMKPSRCVPGSKVKIRRKRDSTAVVHPKEDDHDE